LAVSIRAAAQSRDVALRHGPRDDAALAHRLGDARHDLVGGSKKTRRVAVLDQFDGAKHALAAHLADILVLAKPSAMPR
jgi:hypothetical protein